MECLECVCVRIILYGIAIVCNIGMFQEHHVTSASLYMYDDDVSRIDQYDQYLTTIRNTITFIIIYLLLHLFPFLDNDTFQPLATDHISNPA